MALLKGALKMGVLKHSNTMWRRVVDVGIKSGGERDGVGDDVVVLRYEVRPNRV